MQHVIANTRKRGRGVVVVEMLAAEEAWDATALLLIKAIITMI